MGWAIGRSLDQNDVLSDAQPRTIPVCLLQLPPEAWLRLCTFNCSLTYLVVRPTGSVSLRALGDVGHLDPPLVTFSMHHGIEW